MASTDAAALNVNKLLIGLSSFTVLLRQQPELLARTSRLDRGCAVNHDCFPADPVAEACVLLSFPGANIGRGHSDEVRQTGSRELRFRIQCLRVAIHCQHLNKSTIAALCPKTEPQEHRP